MLDQLRTKNFQAPTRHTLARRRAAACPNALARYVILGAVALSILPAQSLAARPLLLAARAQESGSGGAAAQPPAQIDARPLRELLFKVRRLRDEGAINFGETIELAVEADLSDEASLENVSPVSATPDEPRLRELGEDLVRALSESHALAALKGMRHLRMSIRLDASKLSASLSAESETAERAAQLAKTYDLLFKVASDVRRGQPSAAVLNGMTVSSSGKQLAFRLEMSREAAGNLLFQQIAPN